MDARDIRKKYLEFMKQRSHVIIPRANLVPQEDATTLFTGSGMQPMVPYLLGENHPEGKRLTNSQVCLRAQDIDDIGDDKHTTCFEMLGNWSLGDYFKSEQIQWIAEFLFDVVRLEPRKVYVSCYIGNENFGIPKDSEAISLWQDEFKKRGIEAKVVELGSADNGNKLGMQGGRIFLYDGKENWWSRNGDEDGTLSGDPCGPDSEMFYDFGEEFHDEGRWGKPHPASDSPRFFEIGNNVFMGYRKVADGKFEPLAAPNIDHGSGLERIAAAAIKSPDIFRISLMWPIVKKLEELSGKKYEAQTNAMRVITDHLRAGTFLAVDGVFPSNKEQGYVMRRLVRRAIRYAFELGIEQNFLEQVIPVIVDLYHKDFPEVAQKRGEIVNILTKEEKAFRQTLRKGLNVFEKTLTSGFSYGIVDNSEIYDTSHKAEVQYKKIIEGEDIFLLYDTYGFPLELIYEEAYKRGISVTEQSKIRFEELMEEQRKRSRTATQGQFKGGLGGNTEMHKKYHTATHILYKALRLVLGNHVIQRGSNITEERLRFDFSHPEKARPEQIAEVERIVNENIKKDWPMGFTEMPPNEAFSQGALGAFGDKYGEKVKVYTAGDPNGEWFSKEICGGPHVDHTGELAEGGKTFKITKEEASSAGVRRIKAILE